MQLPSDYAAVLMQANGFYTSDGAFRLFGTRSLGELPSVTEWNASAWRESYGGILEGLMLVAEDVFGDQYGYEIGCSQSSSLLKIYCEGGERKVLEQRELGTFLEESVLIEEPTAYDFKIFQQARSLGLRPELDEHLAFELPLIVNGEYDISNLHVEPTTLHLGVLGQISLNNRGLANATPIRRFT
jgi:hypothetical protein